MQADSIIEKARKLGIDTGQSINQIDMLRHIAMQVGVDDLSELEETLDNMLSDEVEQLEERENPQEVENLEDNYSEGTQQRRERFGEKEYNQARDDSGKYDKNYYANRGKELDDKLDAAKQEKGKNTKEVFKKNEKGEKIAVQKNKNAFDRMKDNANLRKIQNDRFMNKMNSAKSKAFNIMHPGEALKNKAKSALGNAGKEAGKKAAQGAAKAGKVATKAIAKGVTSLVGTISKLVMAHPIPALIIGAIFIVFFILIIFYFGTADNDVADIGYYDSDCNFNDTTVNLSVCGSSLTEAVSLEDYVIGMTYSYTKDGTYSEETIKTLMIIIKTNALSLGGYSSSTKSVSLDDCDQEFINPAGVSSKDIDNLNSIYSSIEEEIFVSTSYTTTISNLSSQNSLELNSTIISQIESLSSTMTYSEILDELYNEDKNEVTIEGNNRSNIFVGDSRMNGMKNYGLITDSNSVYAGSMGYYWFNGDGSSSYDASTYNCKTNAIECINGKIGNESTNIIIWLGVNDVTHYEKYYSKYYSLATGEWSNHYIYIVSVGYVDDDKSQYVKNNQITIFNDYMQRSINGSGLSNLIYVDLGFSTETMGNGTTDGVHYSSSFSQEIYNKMTSSIGSFSSVSSNKQIYKLSNYCTYYNVTENDAYWWPIGSSSTTEGNIYGGAPSTTYVSSGFGPRTINGQYSNHKGIDIADSGCQSNVIIATKSGTVTDSSDSCDNNGSYGNSCGGGYGNYVIIDHGDGTSSVYAHMYPNSITLSVGDTVKQGEKVGLMGNSGSSTGCHLHFEIRLNGVQVNPLDYISADNPRPVNEFNMASVNDNSTSPEQNKVEICKSLLNSGFSKNAVAGMLVNIKEEGAFKTNNLENCYEENQCCFNGTYGFCKHPEIKGFGSDAAYTAGVDSGAYPRNYFVNDRAGYGLIQWTSSNRKAGLYDLSKSKNKSIAALSVQLGWLMTELESYPVTYKYITGNYSAEDIATNFCLDFERPKNKETGCPARAKNNTSSMLSFVNNGCS